MTYRGLRAWLEQVDRMGELDRMDGADRDVGMSAITHIFIESCVRNSPDLLNTTVRGTLSCAIIRGPFARSRHFCHDEAHIDQKNELGEKGVRCTKRRLMWVVLLQIASLWMAVDGSANSNR
jgi:hypothetical protein